MHGADMMYSEFPPKANSRRHQKPHEIRYFDYERPVGIQIFGGDERQWPYLQNHNSST
jgi:hypothetical protein